MRIFYKPYRNNIKGVLRKLGLLKLLQRFFYRRNKSNLIKKLGGVKQFKYQILNQQVLFSVDDPFSASFVSYYLMGKIYEPKAIELLSEHLTSADIFVDVGANIGYFTITMGLCKPGIKIYAFEMSAENHSILVKNIKLNKIDHAEAYQLAVSNTCGICYHSYSAVGNAVLKIVEQNYTRDPDLVCVESVTLDAFFESKNDKPTFVKIDVEGAEMKVLQGMKNLLNNNMKLLIEIHPKALIEFGSSKEKLFSHLNDYGFSLNYFLGEDKKNGLLFAWK
ncbi:MAG: FkbM family methyltransferase [Flavobacteriales bacterium]|nr:FkbM family methyltransferase [Flavobacteriales bacterium]